MAHACIICNEPVEIAGQIQAAESIDLSGTGFEIVRARNKFGIKAKVILICYCCKLKSLGLKEAKTLDERVDELAKEVDESFLT